MDASRSEVAFDATVCGEYLSPGCLPLLRRLSVLPWLRDAGRPLFGMVLRTPAGRVLRARYSHAATPPARRVDGRSLTRARLDPALLDLAIKNGVVVESGFLVRDVRHEGRLVRVTGRLRGRPTDRWARVAVGADGRHSAMARRVGAVHRHPWPDRMALVAHVAGVERDEAADELVPPKDLSLWRLLRRGAVRPSVPA